MNTRKTPYTEKGIRRLKCFRCGKPARTQWEICSDNNTYRPLCLRCDYELNKTVLEFMGFDDTEKKLELYKQYLEQAYGEKV